MVRDAAMKTVGVTEARQNLPVLIGDVRRGIEVLITKNGRPVARLMPVARESLLPVVSRATLRRSLKPKGATVSSAIHEGREDRF